MAEEVHNSTGLLLSCYHHVVIMLSSTFTLICQWYVTTGLSKHLRMSQIASAQCLAWKRLTTGIVLLVFDEYFLLAPSGSPNSFETI